MAMDPIALPIAGRSLNSSWGQDNVRILEVVRIREYQDIRSYKDMRTALKWVTLNKHFRKNTIKRTNFVTYKI